MDEGVRARVEADDDWAATRADEEGKLAAGGTTFRFSVDRPRTEAESTGEGEEPTVDAEPGDTETENEDEGDGESDTGDAEETDDPRYIAVLDDVPTNGTIRCEALSERRSVEFILRQENGEAFAWRNSCPHEPDVKLDPGWGAFVRDGQIVCHEHGARFETGDGLCTYGPCRGKVLDPIGVDVRDGSVYLTDERFEACRRLG